MYLYIQREPFGPYNEDSLHFIGKEELSFCGLFAG
jgi:hypothetical protein